VILQDFPGPGIIKKKNPGLSKRHGNPGIKPRINEGKSNRKRKTLNREKKTVV